MNIVRFTGLAILLLIFQVSEGQQSMISKEQLQEMFDSMAAKTNWNMSGHMLWGYFFTGSDKSVLERAAPHLEEMGYSVKSIFLSDKESQDGPQIWWLHAKKIEAHTVDSLDKTNMVFYEFAEKHNLDSYDGMDVGPIDARN